MEKKIIKGNHRNSGGEPVKGIPDGAGQNGWDDREAVVTTSDPTAVPAAVPAAKVKEEELSSHF